MQKLYLLLKKYLSENNQIIKPQPELFGFFCLLFHTIMIYASVSFDVSDLFGNLIYLLSSINDNYDLNGVALLATHHQNVILFIIHSIMLGNCLLLITYSYWPNRMKNNFSMIWLISLIIIVPFYNTSLLLLTFGQTEWIMTFLAFSMLLMLVVDVVSFFIINVLGIGLGFLVITCSFYLFTPYSIHLNYFHAGFNYLGSHFVFTLPFIICLLIGIIFSRNLGQARENNLLRQQLNAMQVIAASIAHELGTPILTVEAAVKSVSHILPDLNHYIFSESKESTKTLSISQLKLNTLQQAMQRAESEIGAIHTIINMLLVRLSPLKMDIKKFKLTSMHQCINEALERFPYRNPDHKTLINVTYHDNFEFMGSDILMVHVLFNLIKNSLYYIDSASKGKIFISTASSLHYNYLYVKDTGPGISADSLPNIFKRFYTNTTGGTGIGLTFCKLVMELFNGHIECISQENVYTEFKLSFPKIRNDSTKILIEH